MQSRDPVASLAPGGLRGHVDPVGPSFLAHSACRPSLKTTNKQFITVQ
jgi:hypothetical protein